MLIKEKFSLQTGLWIGFGKAHGHHFFPLKQLHNESRFFAALKKLSIGLFETSRKVKSIYSCTCEISLFVHVYI